MSLVQTVITKSYLAKLTYGGDLLNLIREISSKAKIRSGCFTAIGAVRKGLVSYYEQKEKKYTDLLFDEPMEIISCSGSISEMNGNIIVHAHLVLGDKRGMAFGGHLLEGTELFACEPTLSGYKNLRINRKFDRVTGLNLIDI